MHGFVILIEQVKNIVIRGVIVPWNEHAEKALERNKYDELPLK